MKHLKRYVIGTVLVLLVPFVAMFFTDEMRWGLEDFATIAVLLVGAGVLFELVTSKLNARYRSVIAILFVLAVLFVWVELAVGIFD